MRRMTPEELESRLLSCITSVELLLRCEQQGVSTETFVVQEPVHHGEVWTYIVKHAREHGGQPPESQDLETLFGFVSSGPGDLDIYIAEARAHELRRKAREVLLQNLDEFNDEAQGDPSTAVQRTASSLAALNAASGRQAIHFDRDALMRLERFDQARETVERDGLIGVPTGLKPFDAEGRGFLPGEVVIMLGSTGVGKSFMECFMAANAYAAGRKILLISPEMPSDDIGLRLDVMLANRAGIKLSLQELMVGRSDRQAYERWLSAFSNADRLVIVDSTETGRQFSFQDIWRLTLEHRPDVLLVDGLPLIVGEGNDKKGWEILSEGTAVLKALALRERIVIIAAMQADRTSASHKWETTPPTLAQIGYSYQVSQNADHVISMSRVRDRPLERAYRIIKGRNLKEVVERRVLHWNVDNGQIYDRGGAVDRPYSELNESDEDEI